MPFLNKPSIILLFCERKNLVLLDLSFNQITDLVQLVDELFNLEKLKILNLLGNPISVIKYIYMSQN